LAAERDTVSVVDDQRGQPTWTVDLADAIVRLVTSEAPFGTYHRTSARETTWFGFAQEILRLLGHDPGPGAADDIGDVRAAGAPAGVLRAGARRLGEHGRGTHPGVVRRLGRVDARTPVCTRDDALTVPLNDAPMSHEVFGAVHDD